MVDDRPEPERIEIELTSRGSSDTEMRFGRGRRNDADRSDGSEAGDGTIVMASEAPGRTPWLSTERGRLVSATSLVGIVALLLGVLVGRAGSNEGLATTDVPATVTAVATATSTIVGTLDTLPPVEPSPATTSSSGSRQVFPTTPGAQASNAPTVINPIIAGQPFEIVIHAGRGQVRRIDVATGGTTVIEADPIDFGSPALFAGPDWVMGPNPGGRPTVYFDDGTTSDLGVGTNLFVMRAGDERFWISDDSLSSSATRLTEIAIDGSATGAELELAGYPVMPDPLGGIVTYASGGSYIVGPDATTRITPGRLLTLGRRKALVHECDENLVCRYYVVDRSTGNSRSLTLDPKLLDNLEFQIGTWLQSGQQLNPDEDAVLVTTWSPAGRNGGGVLDLETGEYVEIDASLSNPAMDWSPDGRFVFWIELGKLQVFDRSTRESHMVFEDMPTVSAFAIRPSGSEATPDADEASADASYVLPPSTSTP